MIRYKQLITIKVFDKDSNQLIGKIDDVIYSNDYKKIDYLIIKNDNLIKNKAIIDYKKAFFLNNNRMIYLDDVNSFENKLERMSNNGKEGYKFIDKEIRNDDNECSGFIKDVVINKEDGSVDGFVITEGLFEDLTNGRNYLPFLDNIEIKNNYIHIPNNILV